jgi:hypothetical protein
MYYTLYFFLDNVSSTCFGCYLHPSSSAQLQRTAIGICICGKQRFYYQVVWRFILRGCVCTRFSKPRVILMCWCVSLDLFWYCMVMLCGFFADSFVLYFCTYSLVCLFHWSRYWFWDTLTWSVTDW